MTQEDEHVVAILREATKLYAANPAHGEPGHASDGTGPHCAITALAAAEMRRDLSYSVRAQQALAEAAGMGVGDLIDWEEHASTEDVVAAFERATENLLASSEQ